LRRISIRGTALTAAAAVAGSAAVLGVNSLADKPELTSFDSTHKTESHDTESHDIASVPQEPADGRLRQGARQDAVEHQQARVREKARERAARERARRRAEKRAAERRRKAAAERASRAETRSAVSGSPQQVAQNMLGDFGWGASQFGCLNSLWDHESGWDVHASNPSTGAYGIPQALPGSKMGEYGSDWESNPVTQIRWGLHYVQSRYGSPCGAWSHFESDGWY